MCDPGFLMAAAVVLAGAAVQGFLGFGFGIVAMTGLTLSTDLVHAAGLVNLLGLLVTGSVFWNLRREVLWQRVAWVAPAIVLGVVVGVTALREVQGAWMIRVLGLTIVGIAAWNLLAPSLERPRSRVVDLAVGGVAGVLGGAFNTGGPPLVAHLYSLPEPPVRAKATLQALFLSIGLTRMPVATAQGLMGPAVWREALWMAPFVLVGLATGIVVARRVGTERFRRIAWLSLGALGVLLFLGA